MLRKRRDAGTHAEPLGAARRLALLRAGLTDLHTDLVAFQEAVMVDEYDQVSDLLGPDYHIARQTVGLVGDGIAIASRWPLGAIREVGPTGTGRSGGSTTSSCAAASTADPHSRSPPASGSSTNRSATCRPVTTSASWRT